MAAFVVSRAATAAVFAVSVFAVSVFAACGQVVPAARGSDGPVTAPPAATTPAATTPAAGRPLIALGPQQGTLDEAAGRRLTTWLTVIVLAGAGQNATGDPGARPNGYGQWASRIWLRPTGGGSVEGRVSVDVYADVRDRERWQRERETNAGTPHLIAGPLWTVTTSSEKDEALVRRHLERASARTAPSLP